MEEQEEQVEEESTGGGKKLILIIALALVVVIGGAIAFFVLLSGEDGLPLTGGSDSARSGAPAGTAYYVSMPRAFVFNVPGQSRDRLVQISVQLMVRGTRNEDLARQNVPAIEGVLHRTFSATTAERLQTGEGRIELREVALTALRMELERLTGSPVVEEVLFTGFVMQ
ncbi:MAG: flagellar basal body-associated protein FliL [Idiomarina sp.]|nr:flagellar basal body-associated protein FliL [Idiomarina sp.]